MRSAARGGRRELDMKVQERRQQRFTADGELRTESRMGPWRAGTRCELDSREGDESELGIKVSGIIDFDDVKMLGF
jgi:hypothetical protein